MKLRYYLRGLGIGLLVASLILTIAGNRNTMSDADIKARAAQLGMVEKETAVLSETTAEDVSNTESEDTKDIFPGETEPESTAVDESEEEEPVKEPETADETEPVQEEISEEPIAEEETPAAPEEEPEPTSETTVGNPELIISLTVKSGDSSTSVAKRAMEAGLVESATDFDRYLCANGYDKRICVGSYEIASGASMEEIAKTVTRSR